MGATVSRVRAQSQLQLQLVRSLYSELLDYPLHDIGVTVNTTVFDIDDVTDDCDDDDEYDDGNYY